MCICDNHSHTNHLLLQLTNAGNDVLQHGKEEQVAIGIDIDNDLELNQCRREDDAESDNENYSREQEDCENEEELIDNDGLSDPEEREGDHEEAHEDEGDDSMKMMEMSTLY